MQKKRPPDLPKKLTAELSAVMDRADATHSYKAGQKFFEKAAQKYDLGISYLYQLGILYDHYAIFNIPRLKNKKRVERLRSEYLAKAEVAYREILKRETNNLFGYRGLARVEQERGNHKKATQLAVKSYRLMMKLPRKERGVLAVGSFFEPLKDWESAEKWYKKEVRDLGEGDLGAVANLMSFYLRLGKKSLAQPWAKKTKGLLMVHLSIKSDSELEKISRNNKTIKVIYQKIRNSLC
jgi:hypothetical protein